MHQRLYLTTCTDCKLQSVEKSFEGLESQIAKQESTWIRHQSIPLTHIGKFCIFN